MDFTEYNREEEDSREITIALVIDCLNTLGRLELQPHWNGKFTELDELFIDDGTYVKWEDIKTVIESLNEL